MSNTTILSFVFFTALVGFITWLLTRKDNHKTNEGYFLGGRTLTGGYIAGSLLLTNLSAEQLVGLNGGAYADGLSVMAWEVIATIALVAMALFFLPRFLKSGIATVPEFLEQRFDASTRSMTSFIFITAYAVILLPIVLYTGATGLSEVLDVGKLLGIESKPTILWGTVWVIGILGSVYAIFGGLRTVAVSDTLNGFGLLVGGLMIIYYGLLAISPESAVTGMTTLMKENPDKFNSIGGPDQAVPFSTIFTGVLLLHLFYWTTNQQIIQRTLGAKSLKEGQKGVLIAGSLKILGPLILVLPGIIAFHLYSGTGLEKDHAYGTLVRNVLPAQMVGFFAAVFVGAVLSSFNSALNSTATLFSLGIYKPIINPKAKDAKVIRAGKIFGLFVAITAMTIAPLLANQKSIFDYLQKMNGMYFIPIFAVVVVGLLTKRVPPMAAKLGLITGLISIAIGYFDPRAAVYVQAIHEFHFLGIVFVSLVVMMILIGKIAPTKKEWVQKTTKEVDLTPWKFTKPWGISLFVAVVLLYLAFADWSVLATG